MKSIDRNSGVEIERKFLVRKMPDDLASYRHTEITQGYLASDKGGVQVRLRRAGDVPSLTYKRGDKSAREEREIILTTDQFDALWPATRGRRLSKTRYDIPWRNVTIEVDVYAGRNAGLVVAEVEFADEERCRQFVPPDWLGGDVTGKAQYSNVLLARE